MAFSAKEWLRYTRHVQLASFGAAGQTALKQSRVLIVGMGGLGCPVATYLAAAGVGELQLVDADRIDLTNLQRQVLYRESDVGLSKVRVAGEKLKQLNPDITVEVHPEFFTRALADRLSQIDLVIDCTDNFSSRFLINDFCLQRGLPWVYASVSQFAGQCAFFRPGGACFRCLFPEAPSQLDDCNTNGVVGTVPGLLGLIQANEAIAYLAKKQPALENKLLLFDAEALESNKIRLNADPHCRCQQSATLPMAEDHALVTGCVTENVDRSLLLAPAAFSQACQQGDCTVLDVRSAEERDAFHMGGHHVPLDGLDRASERLDKNKKILCYCQSGKRSLRAAQQLQREGYTVQSLDGGLLALLKHYLGEGEKPSLAKV